MALKLIVFVKGTYQTTIETIFNLKAQGDCSR